MSLSELRATEDGDPREGLGLIDRFIGWRAEDLIRNAVEDDEGGALVNSLLPDTQDVEMAAANPPGAAIPNYEVMQRTTWQEVIQIADAHNRPGTFTALIGWEWSSIPAGATLRG